MGYGVGPGMGTRMLEMGLVVVFGVLMKVKHKGGNYSERGDWLCMKFWESVV